MAGARYLFAGAGFLFAGVRNLLAGARYLFAGARNLLEVNAPERFESDFMVLYLKDKSISV